MSELIRDVLHEISAQPLSLAVEIVQFVVLIVIIRLVLVRVVGPALKERRDRIAAEMDRADHADEAYEEARQQSAQLVTEARARAQQVTEAARAATQEERATGLRQIDEETSAILRQAEQTVETEKRRVAGEASEELVTLISQVTRRFIEEAMTESERQALTRKLVLSSLKEPETTA